MPPTHVRRLTRSELRRYSRPLLVPEWQRAGAQERLGDARVLLVGAGGLGCAVAAAVAGAGVGRLRISDHDVIDISNLHRQLLFRSQDVGRAKAAVMAAQVQAINPFVQPEVVPALTPENAAELLSGVTLAIDATDNLAARYALAEAAHAAQVPCVWGAASGTSGMVTVFSGGRRLHDLFPPGGAAADSCDEAGVLGPVPALVGQMMALEALKVLGGVGQTLEGRLWTFDGLSGRVRVIALPPAS
ncbi:HesA/MoeB/ThiF family protein [Deinococcus radiophilus]|uniref:HesA/MoeB/ThiF family protein n=1 Tax=Deinococcus radiophilus TaxID=32062 RepID=A0A3S0I6H7_9DEIO|nr:HesA/MoeB/ThiF family protein [Deinococcus radiophilus]RTR25899.1 HesA/MoeB/ThiF family protein [Deinococcus radiophilus]UFA49689.1 HesA/MoeB/ThiF family protein [Deinococcus radiophilus]